MRKCGQIYGDPQAVKMNQAVIAVSFLRGFQDSGDWQKDSVSATGRMLQHFHLLIANKVHDSVGPKLHVLICNVLTS